MVANSNHCIFIMSHATAGIAASVGYEIGTPAYPDPTHDRTHQLPLTTEALGKIVAGAQAKASGGFLWQVFKGAADGQASSTDVAQAVCKAVMPKSKRCEGEFPKL